MSQSLSNILIHVVFSTKNRKKFLINDICSELFPYIGRVIVNNKCYSYEIGGVADHVHILCALARNISASDLVQEIKTATSRFIKTKGEEFNDFFWQNGYGIFSINPGHLDVVRSYISRQVEHHKEITFEDELRKLLNKYHIEYNEKYL